MQFSATCEYSATSRKLYSPKCSVGTLSTPDPHTSSPACKSQITLGDISICGDGVLQRPNSEGVYEQCEKVINDDGTLGGFPDFCSNDCKISFSSSPSDSTTLTFPNEGKIIFGPKDSIIIGNNMNPYEEISITPYIENESRYDLYFDELCVTKKSGTSINGTAPQCINIGNFYP